MDDRIAFVNACMDREEQVAWDCGEYGRWRVSSEGNVIDDAGRVAVGPLDSGVADGEHIAMQDPKHTLDRIESDRTVLVRLEGLLSYATSPNYAHSGIEAWTMDTINQMAQRYAGWDGWCEEWRQSAMTA